MEKVLKRFEEIGNVFLARYVKPEYEKIVEMERRNGWEKWKTGLLFFVGYSFERQGRPPDWAHIAKEIIENYIEKISSIDELNEKSIWNQFCNKWSGLGGKGFNERLNPIAPNGTPYKGKKYRARPKNHL